MFHYDQIGMDIAQMMRAAADRREAELDACWRDTELPDRDAIDEGRQYVFNLRASADYHERQATRRRNLNRSDL